MKYINIRCLTKMSILMAVIFFTIRCQKLESSSLSTQSIFLQTVDTSELYQAIYQCFTESDPAVLMPYMRREVLMTNDYGEKTSVQWEVLSDLALFFEEHLFSSFKVKHHATAKGGKSEFFVGIYKDREGKEFRIEISAMNCFIDEIDICFYKLDTFSTL